MFFIQSVSFYEITALIILVMMCYSLLPEKKEHLIVHFAMQYGIVLFIVACLFFAGIGKANAESHQWNYVPKQDEMTDLKWSYAEITDGKSFSPTWLVVVCHSNKLLSIQADFGISAAFHWLGKEAVWVEARFGSSLATYDYSMFVKKGESGQLLNRSRAKKFADNLKDNSGKVVLRYTGNSGKQGTMSFPLTGSTSAISKVLKDCEAQ